MELLILATKVYSCRACVPFVSRVIASRFDIIHAWQLLSAILGMHMTETHGRIRQLDAVIATNLSSTIKSDTLAFPNPGDPCGYYRLSAVELDLAFPIGQPGDPSGRPAFRPTTKTLMTMSEGEKRCQWYPKVQRGLRERVKQRLIESGSETPLWLKPYVIGK